MLEIQNIGVISHGEIELDGITVIAGINNKGKSTVGKTLFALLHNMDEWEKTYQKIRSDRIFMYLEGESESLEDFSMQTSGAKRRRTGKAKQLMRRYAEDEDFFTAIEDMQVQEGDRDLVGFLDRYAQEYVSLYVKKEAAVVRIQYKDFIERWIKKAVHKAAEIELDELYLQRKSMQDSFSTVFNKQYKRIGTDSSLIRFTSDARTVTINIKDEWDIDRPLRVRAKIHFIESPRIYDMLSNTSYGYVQREYLQYLMRQNTVVERAPFHIDQSVTYAEALTDHTAGKISEIMQKLTGAMKGQAEFYQKVGLEFKDQRSSGNIHAANVSTGVKALALLEYALRIGAVRKDDILILDEPEINLHPEWQMIYAGALVHLQKHFGIRVLLTTHSPYFVRAIECFADIEGQMERLNVYRAEDAGDADGVTFENLSYTEYGMTSLYDDLSAPLDALEGLLDARNALSNAPDGKDIYRTGSLRKMQAISICGIGAFSRFICSPDNG